MLPIRRGCSRRRFCRLLLRLFGYLGLVVRESLDRLFRLFLLAAELSVSRSLQCETRDLRFLDVEYQVDEWLCVILIGDSQKCVGFDPYGGLVSIRGYRSKESAYPGLSISSEGAPSRQDRIRCLTQSTQLSPSHHSPIGVSGNPQPGPSESPERDQRMRWSGRHCRQGTLGWVVVVCQLK